MFANNGLSLADIAAVTGNNRNNDGGWGDGNGWWILIILFAIFGGWGNNGNNANNGNCCNKGGETVVVPYPMGYGYGFGGAGGWGAFDAASMQRGFDNQAVIGKLDRLGDGICSLGYDQLAQMNGINNTVQQTGFNIITNANQNAMAAMQQNFGLQQAIQGNAVANMQGFNAASRQLADCCCETREAIAQLRYDGASQHCQTMNQMTQDANAIIQNQNQNAQMLNNSIRDGFTALAMEQKNERIAELERKLNASDRQSDLRDTAAYIVNSVNPRTQPAFLTCNPNTGMVIPQSGMDQIALAQLRGNCCQPDPCCNRNSCCR